MEQLSSRAAIKACTKIAVAVEVIKGAGEGAQLAQLIVGLYRQYSRGIGG